MPTASSVPRVLIAVVLVSCAQGQAPAADEKVDAAQSEPTKSATPEPEPATNDPSPPSGRIEDGYFVDDGAPDPVACKADEDCVGDTVPDETGCCQDPYRVVPQTWAYKQWVERWRATACANVTCPPPPAPSEPEACLFAMRCDAGVCRNGCESR